PHARRIRWGWPWRGPMPRPPRCCRSCATRLDVLLRRHLIAARRTLLGEAADTGYETQRLAVGFVDLVGSTALAQQLSTRELGAVLTEFETLAADIVAAAGGRVVKLIGDEVLYTAADPRSACRIAVEMTSRLADHPRVPPARAGVASGEVLLRDGDVFGPTVNLAARAVKVARPGEVVIPAALAGEAGITARRLGSMTLRGFPAEVELARVAP
ncbi:MAG TPA: adenylate/guanylate cyclase domain-containing protein, partial [Thermoleophilaceae bacterium]